ncbi:histidine kinase [Paenibacillus segetis]|uniref:Histidine kinase n=1 Tax=Paenibacillus segetis TaxID=1325360 RepID=A0ABQ1YTA1_9BACL|nr:histidine kinase [Paenibacillus segetis]
MAWRLKWNDWVLYIIRTIFLISVLYFAEKYGTNSSAPMWLIFGLILVSYAVPLLLLQLGKKPYLISELILLALLVPYLTSINHLLTGNLVMYCMMVGFYNERKMYMGSGIAILLIAFAGPVVLLPEAPVSYLSITSSCLIYTALGFVFHILVSSKEEIEKRNVIIQEQYRLLEQHARQVEQNSILKERDRIFNELQHSISHTYTTLVLGLESLKQEISTEREANMVERIMDVTHSGLNEVKQAVQDLGPLELNFTLSEMIHLAIDELNSTGCEVILRFSGEERDLSKEQKLLLIRCLHEAVSLAKREGNAAHIQITVKCLDTNVELILQDDGHGTEEERLSSGLESLQGRLQDLGGHLQISSFLNQGMTVTCTLPIIMDQANTTIGIVVADSEPIVREALAALLSMQDDMQVIAASSSGSELLELCRAEHPDVILLSSEYEEGDCLALIGAIKEISPEIKIIVMTSSDSDQHVVMEAIQLGVEGCMEKVISSRELLSKIRSLYRGEMIITQQLAKQLVQSAKEGSLRDDDKKNEYGLTERELEVLQYLSENLKYKEIAERLFLAEGTVRNYLSVIYSKMNVTSRTEATEKAQSEGII